MADQLIGRKQELKALKEQYFQRVWSLATVYGKRRTGKTALLRNFLADKPAVYYCAGTGTGRDNREGFCAMAAEAFPDIPIFREGADYPWRQLLRSFGGAPGRRPVVVIDEVQELLAMDPSFLRELQCAWTGMKKQAMLVLCGSDVGAMRRTVLEPVKTTVTGYGPQIHVDQLSFWDYLAFFRDRDLTPRQLVERYAITGGIPRYIELFRDVPDLYEAIDELVLNPRGILYGEPYLSLDREITGNGTCFSILRHIGQGENRLRWISAVSGIASTSLSGPLKRLAEMDRIQRIVPVTAEEEEPAKKSVYRLQDNFLAFWFRFVYPSRILLESGRREIVSHQIRARLASEHIAAVYKDVCRERLEQLNEEGQLPVRYSRVGCWWDNRMAVDIVAVDTERQRDILFGACVFQDAPAGAEVLKSLRTKARYVPWGDWERREVYVIFSISGFSPDLEAAARTHWNVLLLQLL